MKSNNQIVFGKTSKPFIAGIGGSGMSSLAMILSQMGMEITGLEKKDSEIINVLRSKDAKIFKNMEEVNPNDYTYCIYSSAFDKIKHPLLKKFTNAQIPVYHRSEILHSIFNLKKSISVAGSHGKTTTTSMISYLLFSLNLDPVIMVGAEIPFIGNVGGQWGEGEWGVYESDESDGTFLNHDADIKVVTNIDLDHLDHYKSKTNLYNAFSKHIFQSKESAVILNFSDLGIQETIHEDFKKKPNLILSIENNNFSKTYPRTFVSYYFYKNKLIFQINSKEFEFETKFPGTHYLTNALLSVLAVEKSGQSSLDFLTKQIQNYPGVKRRFEFLGSVNRIDFYDDYGHHPTEIKAVISSINILNQSSISHGKTVVIFQPHRFTRTRDHYIEFADSLEKADFVFLLPIYSAGETPIEGIGSELIFSKMNLEKTILLSGEINADINKIISIVSTNDKVVSIGAGNVFEWTNALIELMKKN